MRLPVARCALVALVLGAAPAWAQLPGLPRPSPAAPQAPASAPEVEEPDSPRAAVRAFLDLTTKKLDYTAAARYLVLPSGEEARGPELARRLRAVLERSLDIDVDTLSPASQGNVQDGLPDGVDSVGRLPDAQGGEQPLFIVRTRDAAGGHWAFSRQTVSRIDGWYDALPDRWIRDWLPQPLQRYGPAGVMWWQWLALPVLAALALAAGRVFGAFSTRLLHRLFRRTPTQWDERLLERASPALTLLWTVAAAALLLPWLGLRPGAHAFVRSLLVALASVGAFWVLWRAVDVWDQFLHERPWARENPQARSLLSVTRNLARVFVAVTGLVTTLAAFGYPVATVLAGLGIGGIAVAFGAQKTIENLFGSIALAADQPFRVGDFVRIEDVTGNVERIGMRSTQIRTPDRTLVSIPNGKLADMRIEDFAARDRIRLSCTIGLVHGTPRPLLERIIAGMEQVLRDHPLIWPGAIVVRFARLGASSLDLEVMAWFKTTDYDVFRDCQQQVLLGFMRVVEQEGSRFAFPTQTLHVASTPPAR